MEVIWNQQVWNLPRPGRLAKWRNQGRRALLREVTKTPMVTLSELQSSSVKKREPYRRTIISAALISKRHMTARLEFAKRHKKTLRP